MPKNDFSEWSATKFWVQIKISRRKKFTSSTKTSKNAEDVMTWNTSNNCQRQGKTKTNAPKYSKIKVILKVFINYPVIKKCHLSVMRRLRVIIRKSSQLWTGNSWFLLHDNTPSHSYRSATAIFTWLSSVWLLALAKVKRALRGHRFESTAEMQRLLQIALMLI